MRRIKGRFALLVATAAVLPLIVFGLVSVGSLRTGTRQSVIGGNVRVASRASEQIELYIEHAIQTLRAVAAELQGTALEPWQQERVVRNYVLTFPMFRDIELLDDTGATLVTSHLVPRARTLPAPESFDARGVFLSPITIDDELLPRSTVAVQVMPGSSTGGVLVAELRLEEMWRLVDRLRVGDHGFALLVDDTGRLLAHGNPDEKAAVARGSALDGHPLVRGAGDPGTTRPSSLEYTRSDGTRVLGVAAPLPTLNWTLILEQPVDEAYGLLHRLERQLLAAIALALLLTVAFGYFWGRSFIRPITTLLSGTEALAEGRLDARVKIERGDEFATLGDAFNSMADRLAALQQAARRQERQAMFGRIAAGLVHDLSHPIQNIGNNCRLILKMSDDPEYRETFRRTVERELQVIRRLFDDLRNLARPIPLERFLIDLGRTVGDAVESLRASADSAGLTLRYEPPPDLLSIEGDVFALGRVYRNLVLNAIQATAPGGEVIITVDGDALRARVRIRDTGCGIPPDRLPEIFEDFTTTKRRGLGLGLPISKKIVEQLGGTIDVASEVGRGTTIVLEFPRTPSPASTPTPRD